jgi:hypothetical protein
MRRRELVEPALPIPRHQGLERSSKIDAPRGAIDEWRQPVVERGGKGSVRKVGPALVEMAEEGDALAARLKARRSMAGAALAQTGQHRRLHLLRIGPVDGLVFQHQRAEAAGAARHARASRHSTSPRRRCARHKAPRSRWRRSGGEEDARVLGRAVEIGHDQELLVGHRIAFRQRGTAAAARR